MGLASVGYCWCKGVPWRNRPDRNAVACRVAARDRPHRRGDARSLMERGEIIDRLIAVKQTQETGSAFRPAREAEMMRRLVDRHQGILPLDTAESIWRVIISTFTYVQAPFSVHADLSAGDASMRDSARFHFGFTVPFVAAYGCRERGGGGIRSPRAISAWCRPSRRRRPLVERARVRCGAEDHRAAAVRRARDHPAAACRYSSCRAPRRTPWSRRSRCGACASPAGARRRRRRSARARRDRRAGSCLRRRGAARYRCPRGKHPTVTDLLVDAGSSVRASALVGSHATRYRVSGQSARPVPTGR